MEVSSGGYDRSDSGVRLYMVAGLLALGANAVAAAAAEACASNLRP